MHIPHPIPSSETIASVAAGGTFGLLLTQSGKVYTCGYGALGLGRDKNQILMPEQIVGLEGVRKIVASTDYAAAITGTSLPFLSFYYIGIPVFLRAAPVLETKRPAYLLVTAT